MAEAQPKKPETAFDKACKVCSGFGDMFKQVSGKDRPKPRPKQPQPEAVQPGAGAASDDVNSNSSKNASLYAGNTTYARHSDECPEDYLSLGNKSWSFLHTVAAYYKPTSKADEADMAQFIKLVGKFYPCRDCGEHFESYVDENPVEASSPQELAQWLCRAHNAVNVRLGKPEFDCNLVQDRWMDGWSTGQCD